MGYDGQLVITSPGEALATSPEAFATSPGETSATSPGLDSATSPGEASATSPTEASAWKDGWEIFSDEFAHARSSLYRSLLKRYFWRFYWPLITSLWGAQGPFWFLDNVTDIMTMYAFAKWGGLGRIWNHEVNPSLWQYEQPPPPMSQSWLSLLFKIELWK